MHIFIKMKKKLTKQLEKITKASDLINSLMNNVETGEILLSNNQGYVKQEGAKLNMRLLVNEDMYKIDIYTDRGKRK